MDPQQQYAWQVSRRRFFSGATVGLGAAALASLVGQSATAAERTESKSVGALPELPHFPPRAKRIIYLFQSGAPSQIDLFDHKPKLADRRGEELPDSIRRGQRLTTMTSTQASFPLAPTIFRFAQHGASGAWISELLPHTARAADRLSFIKSMHTEAINHDPAITFMQTGSQLAGRPSIGAWLVYGLGSVAENLPAFVVMISQGTGRRDDQPLYDRLWGSGFLPSRFQGVKFRSQGEPVLFLSNPDGLSTGARRRMLDDLARLNALRLEQVKDPEIATRIAQYELAAQMQTSVPGLMDTADEPAATFKLYGDQAKTPGTFAANCLLARRLVERGVRFVQLFHRGWDQHTSLPKEIRGQCRDIDQPSAALVADLQQRGLLDDTLVVWGGEFGRTIYCQGKLSAEDYGRDHHPRCFTLWVAGGGIRPGVSHGTTDDFSYNVVDKPVHVHDLNATLLHCLGIDHERLTFKYQGRHHRLTDVHGSVVRELLV
jgi:hypothetical protein